MSLTQFVNIKQNLKRVSGVAFVATIRKEAVNIEEM
jgi:hypothetical protein